MKRCEHWLFLLCLTISLIGSPTAAAFSFRTASHGTVIKTSGQHTLSSGVSFIETSPGEDAPQGHKTSAPYLWLEVTGIAVPIESTQVQVDHGTVEVIRSAALERPLSCGPPARV